jgi:hypothetical protein
MPKPTRVVIIGGVDSHGRTHHAAVIDQQGRLLGDRQFPADRAGYPQPLGWLGRRGRLGAVRVEGTGSYGAGLTRVLREGQDLRVVDGRIGPLTCGGTPDPLHAIYGPAAPSRPITADKLTVCLSVGHRD